VVNGDEQRSEEVQRWRAKWRAALVISLLKGETTAAEATPCHGLKAADGRLARSLSAPSAENALRAWSTRFA
jgi:hypothetical protein